jgi:hypothetical protein
VAGVSHGGAVTHGSDQPSPTLRLRAWATKLLLVWAGVSIILGLPASTAMWATVRHWQSATGSQGEGGYVTVTRCAARLPLINWSCQGTFQVGDPYYGPGTARDVPIANGFQHYTAGEQVGVNLIRSTHTAYYYDEMFSAEMLAGAAGALTCVVGATGMFLARRRGSAAAAITAAVLILGCLLLLPTVLTVVGVIHTPSRISYGGGLPVSHS